MKLATTITRSLRADMRAELRDIERAVSSGTRDAGRGLRTELRRQVTSAALGRRLANSWRHRHYPNQQLDAASLVYTKAPRIVRACDEGAVVRSKRDAFWRSRPKTRRLGGQITPPIMCVAAFLMAELTGKLRRLLAATKAFSEHR